MLHSGGYLQVTLYRDGIRRVFVHRLVALSYLNHYYKFGLEVNHKDGIKVHNEVSNLEWVTSSENKRHRIAILGIIVNTRGENSGSAKLTRVDVLWIRKSKLKYKELAKTYNVHPSQISRIRNNKRWGHLKCLK